MTSRPRVLVMYVLIASIAAACGADADEPVAAPAVSGSIDIVEPAEGAVVSGRVDIVVAVEDFILEPAGEARDGAGHLHVILDGECAEPGRLMPFDGNHVHLGDGSATVTLDLDPGEHTLCLQAGTGRHIALGLSDTVTFTVTG